MGVEQQPWPRRDDAEMPTRREAPFDVVMATSPTYVAHAATALHSLLQNSPGARPHLLHATDLPQRDRAGLVELCNSFDVELQLRRIHLDRLEGLPSLVGERLPLHSWFRTLIPTVLEDVETALYLDVDLIVLQSLQPLADTSLEGMLLGAVRDASEPSLHGRPDVGLSDTVPYLNSGVLSLDLEGMRRTGFMERVLEVARRHTLPFGDQDALNIVLQGDWLRLHPRWNFQTMAYRDEALAADLYGTTEARQALAAPAIVHFTSFDETRKPWHVLSPHAYRASYWTHRQATPWRRALPEGITARTLVTYGRRRLAVGLGRRSPEPPGGPLPDGYGDGARFVRTPLFQPHRRRDGVRRR